MFQAADFISYSAHQAVRTFMLASAIYFNGVAYEVSTSEQK